MLSQRWPRDARYMYGCPEKNRDSGVPGYAHGYFSRNCQWAFVVIDRMKARTKFEVRSFTRSWDNRGRPTLKHLAVPGYAHAAFSQKNLILNGQSLYTPTLPFLHNFNGLLFGWTLWIYRPNLKSVALPIPEIIGVLKNIGQPLDRPTPTLPFLQNF